MAEVSLERQSISTSILLVRKTNTPIRYFIWRNFPAEIAEELGLPAAVGIREAIREASQRQQTHQVDHSASLFLASYFGLDKSIESLLTDYQVNVDTVPFQYRQSAICAAIFGRNSSTIDLLLRHSAATSLRSTSDATPLHLAARLGHRKNVKTLLHHRAELLNVQDAGGKTALHIACENGHAAVVRVLLQHNANVKLEDNGATGHRPALHRAVRNGRGKVVAVYYEILGLKGIEARSEEWVSSRYQYPEISNCTKTGTVERHGASPNSHRECFPSYREPLKAWSGQTSHTEARKDAAPYSSRMWEL